MGRTLINASTQLQSGTITRSLLNTATSGSAVITKLIAGTNVSVTSTGADAGTGDVTLNSLNNSVRTTVNDINYNVLTTDQFVAFIALTANRTVYLPTAISYPNGSELVIKDETGNCSTSKIITIVANGSDKINGVSSITMSSQYADIVLMSNGTNGFYIGSSTNYASSAQVIAGTDTLQPVNSQGVAAALAASGGGGTPTVLNDVNYTVLTTDKEIAYSSMYSAKQVLLPAASSFSNGQKLIVGDRSGNCSTINFISILPSGSDTITGLSFFNLKKPFAQITLESNGSSIWLINGGRLGPYVTPGQILTTAILN